MKKLESLDLALFQSISLDDAQQVRGGVGPISPNGGGGITTQLQTHTSVFHTPDTFTIND